LYKDRFAVIYGVLAAVAVIAAVFTFLIAFTPITPVAHKSDLGPTTDPALIAQAEKLNAQQAQAAGVTVRSQKVVSVKRPDANTLVISIKTATVEAGTVTATVTLSRGVWTPTGFTVG
jgi:hypothetical protein